VKTKKIVATSILPILLSFLDRVIQSILEIQLLAVLLEGLADMWPLLSSVLDEERLL